MVVARRDPALRCLRNWIGEDSCNRPCKCLRSDLVPPSYFLSCCRAMTPGRSGALSIPKEMDEHFQKAWLPFFCRDGREDGCLGLDIPTLPVLDGQV